MAATLNFTEDDAIGVMRSFFASILPVGIEIIRGQDNLVPEPQGVDWIELTPMHRERTETNVDEIDATGSFLMMAQPILLTVQVDVHGPNSPDNAQIITTAYRDDFAVSFFQASPFDVGPIHADDPKQVPWQNAEQQWETRWIVEAIMQMNQIVTVPIQSATVVTVVPVSVDTL